MTDAHEAPRQDVLKSGAETPRRERHRPPLVAVRVILPLKRDTRTVEGQQTVIADRDAMRVAPEVAQDGGRPAEGRLGVDHPVALEERIDEGVPRGRVAQGLSGAREIEVVPVVRAAERPTNFPRKTRLRTFTGRKKPGVLRPDPALMIGRESTRRHDAVDMRVADQGLAPRVEDAQDADLRAEMPRVGRHLAERRRARLKEPRVQAGAIPIGQRQERMRQREDDVHVRYVEQLVLARGEPALPRLGLALRAVAIATRVIGDGLMSAGVTPIEMPAERGGATARDRPEHRALLHAQPRMLLDEGVTLRVEDIGHLHGGPAHHCGFRSRRDRATTGGGVTCSCSSGLGAAWRCRRDRWRYTVVCDRSAWPSSS